MTDAAESPEEHLNRLEQKPQEPVLAEKQPALLAEAQKRRAALEAQDEQETAEAIAQLRGQLFGEESDHAILQRRVTTAIPAEVVQEARDQIAAYQLKQKTKTWNQDTEGQEPPRRGLLGGMSQNASTTHFHETPASTNETPGVFSVEQLTKNDPKRKATRRAIALQRAKENAGRRAIQQVRDITKDDIDAAFQAIAPKGVRVPQPPTSIKWDKAS